MTRGAGVTGDADTRLPQRWFVGATTVPTRRATQVVHHALDDLPATGEGLDLRRADQPRGDLRRDLQHPVRQVPPGQVAVGGELVTADRAGVRAGREHVRVVGDIHGAREPVEHRVQSLTSLVLLGLAGGGLDAGLGCTAGAALGAAVHDLHELRDRPCPLRVDTLGR